MSSTTAAASSSVGTINVQLLVSQLMAVANQPVAALNTKIATEQTQISAFGTISSQFSTLQTSITQLNIDASTNAATMSNTSVASATAGYTAMPGTYTMNVSSLAQAQSLVSAGQASSTAAIGNGVATTLTFNFGTTTGTPIAAGTTAGSTTVTGSTAGLTVGATITGPGIPAGATVASITNGNSFVISAAATATNASASLLANGGFTSNGSASQSITISSANNTLQGIATAINTANIGVTATIINDGSATAPYHISITSNSTGASNSMQITTTGGDGTIGAIVGYDPASTENMNQTVAAQNANFTLNGIAVTSATNTVPNAIQGVSLTLSSVTTTPATLTVGPNTSGVTTDITSFVNAYNSLWKQLSTVSAYGAAATSAGGATTGGILAGNGTVRALMTQMQSVLDTAVTPAPGGSLNYLAQIGVTIQRDGTLAVDSTALNKALTSNFADVNNLLTSSAGVLTNLNNWANTVLTPGSGMIPAATSAISATITLQQTQVTQMNAQLTTLQAQYLQQYTNLNMLLTNMNGTSTYLTQQFAKN